MNNLKKVISAGLIFSLTLVQFAQAQGYESIFGDSSTSWKFFSVVGEFGGIIQQKVDSDTTFINNKAYRELTSKNIFLRESSANGKIWTYDPDREEEFLVMDLSLQKKDSFFVPYAMRSYIDSGWHVVDSIALNNNRKHIYFNQKPDERFDSLKFIEGIGPNFGFYDAGRVHYMICAVKDGKTVFLDSNPSPPVPEDTNFYSCPKTGNWWTGIEESNKQKFQVKTWPNPANDQVQITFTNQSQKVVKLKIFNLTGQMVLSKQTSGNAFQIQRPGQAGMYFYHLLTSKGDLINSGKLLFVE